jgi:hypothetical protein
MEKPHHPFSINYQSVIPQIILSIHPLADFISGGSYFSLSGAFL